MKIDFENIDQLFEDSLTDLDLTPSKAVKPTVMKKMFWHNVFVNTYVRISVLSIILLTVGASFFYFNSNNVKDVDLLMQTEVEPDIVETQIQNSKQEINIVDENNLNKSIASESIYLSEITTEKKLKAKPEIQKQESNLSDNTSPDILLKSNNGLNKTVSDTKAEETKEVILYDGKTQPKQIRKIETAFVLPQQNMQVTPEKEASRQVNTFPIPIFENKNIFVDLLVSKKLEAPISSPTLDNYPLRDDTVGINIRGEKIVLPSNRWSLGAYIRSNYSFARFSNSKEAESLDISTANKEAYQPSPSYGLGLELSYQFKQLSVGLGFATSESGYTFK